MAALLLLLIIGLGPESHAIHDHRTVVEINVVYDGDGNETFRQYLFWSWNGGECRHYIDAWHIIKSEPVFNNDCLLFWEGNRLRRVRADEVRERHLQYDIEIEERQKLEACFRRGLTPHKGR